jgi:hypothetical protein
MAFSPDQAVDRLEAMHAETVQAQRGRAVSRTSVIKL